ncbi:TetR/AcrR family transcriptional regulator [Alteromonas antoniana]|uniref:TetR/AcrR family transcriptional regulator n=1 Tax=Alteromonas antoniana TaxID=2803813 RepID=UPI001C4657CF|nr:TetR/AcrR family transcriptional regulator [Alteromonas antoniana]
MNASVSRAGRPKSEAKRRQILHAASELFLNEGFANTSMDKVAKASGVSKQTVYSHFESKDSLYTAAIENKCLAYQLDPARLSQHNGCQLPLEDCLQTIGVQFVKLFHDEEVIAMYRVVIAEANNNPHVAELFYNAGPKASIYVLAGMFETFSNNRLSHADALALAIDYFSLLKGEFHIRTLFGLASPLSGEQIEEKVRTAVAKTLLLFNHAAGNSKT